MNHADPSKTRRRLLMIGGKAACLVIKLVLIRCFGIECAACMLAGVASLLVRLRTARPRFGEIAIRISQTAQSVCAATFQKIREVANKIKGKPCWRQRGDVCVSRRS